MQERHPTARRIVCVGMRLFAEQGIKGTPITQIEQEAGLAPGSGAFYKHFGSKEEIYGAALEEVPVAFGIPGGTDLPGDLAIDAQAELLAVGILLWCDQARDLILVTMRERALSPQPWGVLSSSGHEWIASWLRSRTADGQLDVDDPDGTAVVLLGAVTAYWLGRRQPATAPLGVDDGQFVKAWSGLVTALLDARRHA